MKVIECQRNIKLNSTCLFKVYHAPMSEFYILALVGLSLNTNNTCMFPHNYSVPMALIAARLPSIIWM